MTFFHDETLNIQGIEGKYLSVIKNIYDKPKSNIIFNSEHLKAFSLIRNKIRMPTSTLIQYSSRSSCQNNQVRQRNKRHPKQKGRSKIFIFYRGHDFVFVQKISQIQQQQQQKPELINKFSKFVRYKITIQNSTSLLWTINETSKKKLSNLQQHQNQENRQK